VRYGILPDHSETLRLAAVQALLDCDVMIITAGSSASSRDLTAGGDRLFGPPGCVGAWRSGSSGQADYPGDLRWQGGRRSAGAIRSVRW